MGESGKPRRRSGRRRGSLTLLCSVSVNLAELRRAPEAGGMTGAGGFLALLRSVSVNLAELRRVLGWSSGAPGGGIAGVGGDDVARLAFAKVGAARLYGGALVSEEKCACLGGEAARARIGVPSFGVDPLRGDEGISASINIAVGSHGRVATCGGTKLSFVNAAQKLGHLALLTVHFVIDGLLLSHLSTALFLLSLLSLKAALALGHKLLAS